MTRLDCRSPDQALRSLAAVLQFEPDHLRGLLIDAPVDGDFRSRLLREPYDAVVCSKIGVDYQSSTLPSEVIWFHGTRLPPGTSFALGLLPLSQCLENLRAIVHGIAHDLAIPHGQGYSNSSYCSKVARLNKQGPCASLLKDAVVRPTRPLRDFLASPEIVEDLAQERAGDRFNEIIQAYQATTQRCVVSFRSSKATHSAVPYALAYCHRHLHELDDPVHWNTCFDGQGVAIPPEDIVQVEWLPSEEAAEASHASR